MVKTCNKCQETKDIKDFYFSRQSCIKCIVKQNVDRQRFRIEEDKKLLNSGIKMDKQCSRCEVTKDISEFYTDRAACKECVRKYNADRAYKLKNSIQSETKEKKVVMKKCRKCEEIKPKETHFYKFQSRCKICLEFDRKAIRIKNNTSRIISEDKDKDYTGMFYMCKGCRTRRPSYRFKAYLSSYRQEHTSWVFNLSKCSICVPDFVKPKFIKEDKKYILNYEFYKKAEEDFDYKATDREYIPTSQIMKQAKTLIEEIKEGRGRLERHHPFVIISVYVDIFGCSMTNKDIDSELVDMYSKILIWYKQNLVEEY